MNLLLNSVHVGYGRHRVIDNLTSQIKHGRITGLIGPNGSGKSTLIRAVAGVLPHRGTIALDGVHGHALRLRTGYMPQEIPSNVALTALESVIVSGRRASSWRTSRNEIDAAFSILHDLGIGSLADQSLAECSGGQRQLISLAQTLARTPQLIVLDEPTSALDLRHQIRVLHSVQAYVAQDTRPGLAIIALHDLNLAARYCDDLLLVHHGQLIAHGTPTDVLRPEILDDVYGIKSRIIIDGDHIMVTATELP